MKGSLAMRSLDEVSGEALRWVKPKWFKHQYELRAGEEVVATLVRSGGSGGVGEWSGGRYSFFQKGWFNQRIFVGDDAVIEDNAPLATFTRRDGVLTLADGRTLFWKKPSFWKSRRVWSDGAASLVEFDPASGYASPQVTISPEGAYLDELPLLLLLGQYLIVRGREEADATSAATTATIVASS
jgi:hypothetical protein